MNFKSEATPKVIFLSIVGLFAAGSATSQALMSLGSTLLIIGWVYYFALSFAELRKKPFAKSHLYVWTSLAYCLWLFIGLLWISPFPSAMHSGREIPIFLVPSLLFLPAFRRAISIDRRDLKWPFYLSIASVAISLGYLIYKTLVLNKPGNGIMGSSIYTGYNLLGPFLFAAVVFRFGPAEKIWRRGSMALGLMAFYAIFLSGSRVVGTTALVIILWLLIRELMRNRAQRILLLKWFLGIFLLTGTLAVYRYQSDANFKSRIQNSLAPTKANSFLQRRAIWAYNWKLFTENPLMGVGYKKNGMKVEEIPSLDVRMPREPEKLKGFHAHSIYLQALAESGTFGFILLCLWLAGPVLIDSRMMIFMLPLAIDGLNEAIFYNSRVFNATIFYILFANLFLACRPSKKSS